MRARERGQAILVLALAWMVMLGMAALAIDLGTSMSGRRGLQVYADAALQSGANAQVVAKGPSDTAHFVALEYLARSFSFAAPSVGTPVVGSGGTPACTTTAACPAGTYLAGSFTITFTDSSGTLDLSVQQAERPLLAGVLGVSSMAIGASSRVGYSYSCPAFCVLNKTMPGALTLDGMGSSLQLSGPTNLVVNSSASDAATLKNGKVVMNTSDGGTIGIVGGLSTVGAGSVSPAPTLGVPPVVEPPSLAALPVPTFPLGTPVQSFPTLTTDVWLNPGVYDQIAVSGGGHAWLNPGTYVITGGMSAVGLGEIDSIAPGVTLYFTCSSWPAPCAPGQTGASLSLAGNGDADLTAPASGQYQGLTVFYDRNNTASTTVVGNGALEVHGTIYERSGGLVVDGNGVGQPLDAAIVVDHIKLTGNALVQAEYRTWKNVPGLETTGPAGPVTLTR